MKWQWNSRKMQLDIDIEPILRFPGMTSIDKQMDVEYSASALSGVYIRAFRTNGRGSFCNDGRSLCITL